MLAGAVTVAVGIGAALVLSPGLVSRDEIAARTALVDPSTFARRLADPDTFVVNVHVPYEGEIEGTDAFIPYDQIAGDDRLPPDSDTEILLYCRSGRMSASVSRALEDAGYTNIVDLDGGMVAWEAGGRPVLRSPRD